MENKEQGRLTVAVPLPLTAPGPQARLAGMWSRQLNPNPEPLSDPGFEPCGLPLRVLPNPAYLFTQGIVPQAVSRTVSERDFYAKLKPLFTPETRLAVWSVRQLEAVNALCLRLFVSPDLLKKPLCVLDLRKTLRAAALFGDSPLPVTGDFQNDARACGFTGELRKERPQDKLEALRAMLSFMQEKRANLLRFALRSLGEKRAAVGKCLETRGFLANITQKLYLEILRPLNLQDDLLTALSFDGESLIIKRIPLCCGDLLAPATILTPARQQALRLNLAAVERDLLNTDLKSVPWENYPYWQDEALNLTGEELAFVNECRAGEPDFSRLPPQNCSPRLKLAYFLARADNDPAALSEKELAQFTAYTKKTIQKTAPVYFRELSNLENAALNESDAALLAHMAHFLQDL